MAFKSWENPRLWIEAKDENNLKLNRQTADQLAKIHQPVTVVSIAGKFRSGKSYLMNILAGRHGFELGSTLQSHTKGIWVWCLQHPLNKNQVLVLLDTEGLDDAEKGNTKQDLSYFSLAVLLSSTFIFNIGGRIDQDMINNLHLVTELTEKIKVKSVKDDEEEGKLTDFTEYFPHFVLAVRDFTLELKLNGEDVTPNQYFNHILKLRKGESKAAFDYNHPREAIRRAFKSHSCFVFTRPVSDELFPQLAKNNVQKEDLLPRFVIQSDEFCQHVLSTAPIKKLKGGQNVTGQVLKTLAEEYVRAINSGAVPCIESTLTLVAQRENNRILEESLKMYDKLMAEINFPVSSDELNSAHVNAFARATEYFNKNVMFDDNKEIFEKCTVSLAELFMDQVSKNSEMSVKKCEEVLDSLITSILGKNSSEKYACAGGYNLYYANIQKVWEEYNKTPGKGVKADEVWLDFMKDREFECSVIMAADNKMTEEEKKIEMIKNEKEKAEREAATKEAEIQEHKVRISTMEEESKTQLTNLQREFEKQQAEQVKETNAMIERLLEEQKQLLNEGFHEKAEKMKEEIDRLKRNTPSTAERIVSGIKEITSTLVSVLPTIMQTRMLSNALSKAGKLKMSK